MAAQQVRNVLILASAQALFQTASVMVMTVGALAATHIAPEPWLATAPIAAMFLAHGSRSPRPVAASHKLHAGPCHKA